jgi:hypothetical protein
MDWDTPYVVASSLKLQIPASGGFLATTELAPHPRALTEDALPVLTAFAVPTTPRAALTKLRESWEIDDDGFAATIDGLLQETILAPADAEAAPRRDLFLIVGINRGGTSALTKALGACGVALDFGQPGLPLGLWKNDESRADGGYESYEVLPVLELVRAIVFRYVGDGLQTGLTEEIVLNAGETLAARGLLELIPRFPFAIKDPMLTFLIPQWKQIARDCRPPIAARPVVPVRHPVASAHALLKRRFCRTLRGGLEQWFRYYSEIRHLFDIGEEPLIVMYDGHNERFVAQIEALCATLSLPFDGHAVSEGFIPAGVDRPDLSELAQHPWGGVMQQLYEDLESRAVRMP